MKPSVRETEKTNSLIAGMSLAGKHFFNLSAKLSILFAAFLLTLHTVLLMWGSVLLWSIHWNWPWAMGLLVAVMVVMLVARMCSPAKSAGWWYAL